MGMDVGGSGSKDCRKGDKFIKYGGDGPSKGLGIQLNHGTGYQPKNYL